MNSFKYYLGILSLAYALAANAHSHGAGNIGGGSTPTPNTPPPVGTPASPTAPGSTGETCLGSNNQPLDIINAQVLEWKGTTANAFLARAHIYGTVDEVFPDHSGHRHFSLKIGPQPTDHIEVIYNLSFGQMPTANIGDTAEACGDYITSIAQTGSYPPSPDGGIIHWVHRSPRGHLPGYVILNGVKY